MREFIETKDEKRKTKDERRKTKDESRCIEGVGMWPSYIGEIVLLPSAMKAVGPNACVDVSTISKLARPYRSNSSSTLASTS